MSGFDRFLKEIGAITGPEGTSADIAIPEVVKKLKQYLEELARSSPSDDLVGTSDYGLTEEWLSKAEQAVAAGDFERAYFDTLNAIFYLGHAARAAAPVPGLEQLLNAAFEQHSAQ